jgi:hypothetical protein
MGNGILIKKVDGVSIFVEDLCEKELNESAAIMFILSFLLGVAILFKVFPPLEVVTDPFASLMYVLLAICVGGLGVIISMAIVLLPLLPVFESSVEYFGIYSSRDFMDLIKIKKSFNDSDQRRVCMAAHHLEEQIKSDTRNSRKLAEIAEGCK